MATQFMGHLFGRRRLRSALVIWVASATFSSIVKNAAAEAGLPPPTPTAAPAAPPPAEPAAEAAPPAPPPAENPPPTPEPSEEASAETSGSLSLDGATASASSEDSAAPGDEAEPESEPAQTRLYLEALPHSAYPNDPLSGIAGGSLAGTSGLQFPYMPQRAGEDPLRIGMSGSIWVDGSLRNVQTGLEGETDVRNYSHQGRFVLRTTPVYNVDEEWFVQGQGELVGNADQDDRAETQYVTVDDLWVRTGIWNVFDIQAGRMQGWEVYHLGMGLDLNTLERQGARGSSSTPIQIYGLTKMWDRGLSEGSVAAHLYPTDWARLEVQARFGLVGDSNFIGVRPVGVLDFEYAKLKFGYETSTTLPVDPDSQSRKDSRGLGVGLQGMFDPWVEGGVSYAEQAEEQYDSDGGQVLAGSATTRSIGGFLNARPYLENLMVGIGYHYTWWENLNLDAATGRVDEKNHTQMFAAIQYALFGRLTIKYVFSPSNMYENERSGAAEAQEFENDSTSHRLRFAVAF